MGWNRKRDAIEPACVELLERAGWKVLRISVKNGPDLIASKALWFTVVIEVKSGKSSKLRPGQQRWQEAWPGMTLVVHSVDALAAWLKEPGLPMTDFHGKPFGTPLVERLT